ncbi:F-box protein CPR1-like [Papaver somniferum]|uniref:F-box protein CPR1-like n=1 Tax=Papaver somniferum TaxID=3469 RepID=UPI000E6F57EB|nr:F-box protein CPR1-like [Papaver somniferum]
MVEKKSKLGTFILQQPPPKSHFLLLSGEGFKELEDLGRRPFFKDANPNGINMVDSVHGIFFLHNRMTRDIALRNPATRQCRLLPKSSNGNPKVGHYHRDFVGLGFDVETRDYKVIPVFSLEPPKNNIWLGLNCMRKVQIYCLSTDSWRLVDSDFRTRSSDGALGRSLNGIYFHLGVNYSAEPNEQVVYCVDTNKQVILSFDLSKEKYRRIRRPVDQLLHLESIGDKLACISECSGIYKVWMLGGYNTEEEMWTELYRVGPLYDYLFDILTFSWNGKYSLCVCNSITDEFEDLALSLGPDQRLTILDHPTIS